MKAACLLALSIVLATGCAPSQRTPNDPAPHQPPLTVRHINDVEWTPLNPARGDQSPKAATLWGDRNADQATGFLVQFADGFSSPPHIHNVTYRGIVLRGLVHNDDPEAAPMWMPPGSYWTQPKGESHITAARGDANLAYIEIAEGPYLVQPTEDAFDSGERPINIDRSNIVWLDASNSRWIESDRPDGPQIAHLWGRPQSNQPNGCLLRLPPGFTAKVHARAASFRAVVIQGSVTLRDTDHAALTPGSTFSAGAVRISTDAQHESLIYIRTTGAIEIAATK